MTDRTRISKVTTRAGDKGTTKLATGRTVSKASHYVTTVGSIDELNSHLGLVLAELSLDTHANVLLAVQQDLFDMGAVLALEGSEDFAPPSFEALEAATEAANATLPPLTEFVLPRGSRLAASLHVARAVCRRAEANFWNLIEHDPVGPSAYIACAQYLNRLSDLLFVLARCHSQGDEQQWRGPAR